MTAADPSDSEWIEAARLFEDARSGDDAGPAGIAQALATARETWRMSGLIEAEYVILHRAKTLGYPDNLREGMYAALKAIREARGETAEMTP